MKKILTPVLIFFMTGICIPEVVEFTLQSSDSGPVTGNHSGRPYHEFNNPEDEAIYLTVSDWQGGHNPNSTPTWPLSDGLISWDTFTDPNGTTNRPEVITVDGNNNLLYVYWNTETEEYELLAAPDAGTDTLQKQYYEEWTEDRNLNFGNDGKPAGALADRQNALITEFKLERPYCEGLTAGNLISASIEITIDRIIDMSLSGNNMALIPSKMFVNAFEGDGIVGRYENAQEDFEQIDHTNADKMIWLTIDNTPGGINITDFALSYYKLVDPGLGEPYSFQIDVTDTVFQMLTNKAEFAGFVFSGSPDGEFCLASMDLVDKSAGKIYLPKLMITADIEPLISDLDLNKRVDLNDFAIFSASWLTSNSDQNFNPLCDIHTPADGQINMHDLMVFVQQWLVSYCL